MLELIDSNASKTLKESSNHIRGPERHAYGIESLIMTSYENVSEVKQCVPAPYYSEEKYKMRAYVVCQIKWTS